MVARARTKTKGEPAGSNGRAPRAVLTQEERASVAAARGVLATKTLEKQLVERALASLWQAIRDKYKLPESFDFDPQTGEVTPRG